MKTDTINAVVDTITAASSQITPTIIHTDGIGYDLSYLNTIVTVFSITIALIGIAVGRLQWKLNRDLIRTNKRIDQISEVEERVNAVANDAAIALINANRGMYKNIDQLSPYKIIWHVRYLHSLFTYGKERNEDQLLKKLEKECNLYKTKDALMLEIASKLGKDLQDEFEENLFELSRVKHKPMAAYFSELRAKYLIALESKGSTPSKS